ncbi:2-nitropropane dioxygenase [Cladochytrium replicatum]|nr:2-nitropropane dioxygenase [Cladochytrium replicatum]
MKEIIETSVTKLLNIKVPIILAGMNVASGPELAAAVTNAGGLGVFGGLRYTPAILRQKIRELKSFLVDKNAPFGVDLLLPQIGGNARKTNSDYTQGQLPELIDVIVSEGAKVFVSAVGVPPRWVVEKLHSNDILYANIVGSPKHVTKALELGVDLIIAQGGEGGGHTGDVATSILIPAIADVLKGTVSAFTGQRVPLVAAGGIFDGRGLAMALGLGAEAVWVGTRFVCATEAGAPKLHQEYIVKAGVHDTIRTTIFSGRPMRVLRTPYIAEFEENRHDEIMALQVKGIIPIEHDLPKQVSCGKMDQKEAFVVGKRWLMGQAAGVIFDVKPAKEIMEEMVSEAVRIIRRDAGRIVAKM